MKANQKVADVGPGLNVMTLGTCQDRGQYGRSWPGICPDCNEELTLARSTKKYKQLGCPRGQDKRHGCGLSTSKSVRVIEESLLGFITDSILTESAIKELVRKSNEILLQEAEKPRVDTRSHKAESRKREAKIKKLVRIIEDEPDDNACRGYHDRIKEHQEVINRLRRTIQEADARNANPPRPMDMDRVQTYLSDLRATLSEDVPEAAAAIRTLTGPIEIRQELIPGRTRGARWIARFSPNLMRLLREQASAKNYPESAVLARMEPTNPQSTELIIEKVPKYEQLAPNFKAMRDAGASIQTIASAHGVCWDYADQILRFADTGERPKWKAKKRTGKGGNQIKHRAISKEVAALRDEKKMSFARIATELTVSENTVRRAYDVEHQDDIREAATRGETPSRGR